MLLPNAIKKESFWSLVQGVDRLMKTKLLGYWDIWDSRNILLFPGEGRDFISFPARFCSWKWVRKYKKIRFGFMMIYWHGNSTELPLTIWHIMFELWRRGNLKKTLDFDLVALCEGRPTRFFLLESFRSSW